MSPKKPNSGKRRVAKARIKHRNRKDRITAKITGYDYFPGKFSRLLIEGGRANDTPGVTYTVIRGAFDCAPLACKHYRRSVYGVRRLASNKTFVRRSMRRKSGATSGEADSK